MLRSRNYLCLLLFAPVSLIGPTVGCTGKIDSPLLNRPLVIDGDDADWGEARLFLKEIQGSQGSLEGPRRRCGSFADNV